MYSGCVRKRSIGFAAFFCIGWRKPWQQQHIHCTLLLLLTSRESQACRPKAPHSPLPPTAPPGTNAEFVAADEATLCHIPPGISFQEAAAVPVSGLTAWQALEPAMPLEGKRLLVHGGAGGVGSFAVQASGGGWFLN